MCTCAQVYRSGKWQKLPGEVLLPGDVISIARAEGSKSNDDEAVAPADVLLISGTCVADEAVLTGESTPQWKEAITTREGGAAGGARAVDVRQDKRHVIFGGTKLLNSAAGEKTEGGIQTPDGGALGVVLRTGFETAQGRLMRMILFSTERLTANTVETGLFICFLLIFALAAAGMSLQCFVSSPQACAPCSDCCAVPLVSSMSAAVAPADQQHALRSTAPVCAYRALFGSFSALSVSCRGCNPCWVACEKAYR